MTGLVELLGQQIEDVSLEQAVDQVVELATGGGGIVVTLNVDHAVRLPREPRLREAYARAALRYADGMPVVWLARLVGRPLPGRVAGADLVPAVLARAAELGLRVHLVGGSRHAGQQARARALDRHPRLLWTGEESPPYGFERDADVDAATASRVAAASPDIVLVCLGSPKQEEWALRHHHRLPGAALLCVGAAVDFLAGTTPRAPAWMQRAGLEWLHRLAGDPRRLWRRYLVQDAGFVPLAAREVWRARVRRPVRSPGAPPAAGPPTGSP